MSEEKIKILEQRIDFLYRLQLLGREDAFSGHIDELEPLFDLSVNMEETNKLVGLIEVKIKKLAEKEKKLIDKFNKLKSDLKSGKILVKDEEKTKTLIDRQEEKHKKIFGLVESHRGVKRIEESLRKELLRLDLKEKLGISLSKGDDWSSNDFHLKERFEEELKQSIASLQEILEEYEVNFG